VRAAVISFYSERRRRAACRALRRASL